MAIDTELKRKSIAAAGNVALPISLVPNATPGNPERQAVGWSYSGVPAIGAPGPAAGGMLLLFKRRRKGR